MLWLTTLAARRCGFTTEDEITTVFCGSKKTLASGVPMAKVLFGTHPALGVIVLPLMFYHQLQLFVCSVLAQRYAQRGRKVRSVSLGQVGRGRPGGEISRRGGSQDPPLSRKP